VKRILIIVLLLVSVYGSGQHCGYDFKGLIVLNIHSKNSTEIIGNLKITLLDSMNQTVMTKFYRELKTPKRDFVEDTLKSGKTPANRITRKLIH